MNAREKEFEQKFGCNPSSVLAYEAVHPEMCTRFIARRKKTEMISYRLPAEAVLISRVSRGKSDWGSGFPLFAFVVTDMNTWYNSTSYKT